MHNVRRTAGLAVVALGLAACTPRPGTIAFRAGGAPRRLPPDGALTSASEPDFEGTVVGLRGRPVVVNVWASWCGPCRVEAPLLQRAANRYGADVAFLGVNAQDQPGPARAFLRRYHISYPSLVDDSGDIWSRLGVRGLPTTFVFSRSGTIRARVVGGISEQTLAAQVQAALR